VPLATAVASVPADARAVDSLPELDAWLDRLVSGDASARDAAVRDIERTPAAMLPAIADRLVTVGARADRAAMSAVVTTVVKPRPAVDRDEIPGRLSDGGFQRADDWLVLVMAKASPDSAPWRDLAEILGLFRRLGAIGTTDAARALSAAFGVFGDILRLDLERQLVIMGNRALPALIEMRRAEGKEQRLFALKVLEALGKAIPGEAVQTGDDLLLVEVLRAYGRAHEIDAARVMLSFANGDRRIIREAAREAVRDLGAGGLPTLRETYENLMSKKAPDDWDGQTTARELFQALDRARLSEAYTLVDEGLLAYRERDLERATSAFDRALARDPDLPRRAEMAPGYLAWARTIKREDRGRAVTALYRALRVDPGGPVAREAESELLVLEARDRAEHGLTDEASLKRAIELDPGNADAKEALARIEADSAARSGRLSWYLYAALAAFVAVAGLVTAFAHGRRSAR
jgi:tetratricopeptide (TPR) repeat protein